MFHFMDGMKNWVMPELERRQVRTINEAITQDEALKNFRHEKFDRARKKRRGSYYHVGEDRGEVEEKQQYPKNYDTYRFGDKRFVLKNNMKKNTEPTKRKEGFLLIWWAARPREVP